MENQILNQKIKGKLLIFVGISGSGKSTYASSFVQSEPSKYIRVNRDKIREMLFSYTEEDIENYYLRDDLYKLEKEVTKYEDTLIYEGLEAGKTVIVDATHLKRSYLERFKYWNVKTELIIIPITLKEALTRNIGRNRKVSEDVIKKQYNSFINLYKDLEENPIDFTPKSIDLYSMLFDAWIIDIDGTLAHMKDRSPFDWKRVVEDRVDKSVQSIISNFNAVPVFERPDIIICTGRDQSCEEETIGWLAGYGIEYDELHMRAKGDNRPDWVVKEEMWRDIALRRNILGLIDDRQQVVRRARALGLKVFNVEYNNF